MDTAQWESLCDHCGRCCLQRLEADGQLLDTCLACRLYDAARGRCGDYAARRRRVPECVALSPAMGAREHRWLPPSCAYRRLAEGRGLPSWHPLRSGDPDSGRRQAGIAALLAPRPRQPGSVRLRDYLADLPAPPE